MQYKYAKIMLKTPSEQHQLWLHLYKTYILVFMYCFCIFILHIFSYVAWHWQWPTEISKNSMIQVEFEPNIFGCCTITNLLLYNYHFTVIRRPKVVGRIPPEPLNLLEIQLVIVSIRDHYWYAIHEKTCNMKTQMQYIKTMICFFKM